MATNGNGTHQQDQYSSAADAGQANSNLSKDEVGWYFVEQYYTTLGKSPDKLHLFYGKQSQFVYGKEAEVTEIDVGRANIQARIKKLAFEDCKVRISNVDSQASFDNIVIQVIGESSAANRNDGEPTKFVQTFVLAQQPSGYFVLNDILRYVDDERDDDVAEAAATEAASTTPAAEQVTETAPVAEPEKVEEVKESVQEESTAPLDTGVVDKKLEEAVTKETPSTPAAEPIAEPATAPEEVESKPNAVETAPEPEKVTEEVAKEEIVKPEAPKDPSPTPVSKPQAPPAEPEKPKPMSWASLAAKSAGPTKSVKPVVPLPKAAAPPAQVRSTAVTQPSVPVQPAAAAAPSANKENENGWQSVGADSKKQRPQSVSGALGEREGVLGYIKNVTEKVKEDDLKAQLSSFGELQYFDISRAKNCAFIEYATPAGYSAAAKASPITVNGEVLVIEPRKPKSNAYGGANYSPNRGGNAGRGRGGFEGGRQGSQGGGRGGFAGRGRGGNGAPRGRGGPSQAANA